ncbi:MAG: hypothetical protein JXB50_06180 [Spirochaetes bacterium]|nr:hypothetical protein [Spirochaetota bacterium]
MKKIAIILLLMIFSGLIFAHAPSEITLSYNKNTNMLSINVVHPIASTKAPNPMKHFIKDISVSVNGKTVIVETIAFQQSEKGEISTFLLKVKSGDKVSVKAVCSISGLKISEIVIK